jgi:hypothetical protein
MSSHKSPIQPVDAGAALRDAFVEVCENSFFAYVESCDAHRFAELAEQCSRVARALMDGDNRGVSFAENHSEWLKAAVGFGGAFNGAIEVILPEPLAAWLVASILGEPPETKLAEHQVFDGFGEFANMVCGAWLTNLSQRQSFELRSPAVTRMAPDWTPLTDSSWNDEQGHRLVVNDLPVRVRLRSLGGPA